MSLACDINEEELMQDYPLVYKGVYTEKKDIAEMLTQQKTTRKRANDELQLIPAKVQAQDALKVDEDFDNIESEKVKVEAQLANIEANLQGVVTESLEMQEYKKRVAEQEAKNQTAHKAWTKAHFAEVDNIFKQVSEASEALRTAKASQKTNLDANIQNKAKLASLTNEFNDLMQQWKDVNEKEFSYAQTDICPVCGRPYTDEMKEQEYANAVSEYNTNKASKLMEIQNKATEKHGQITVIKGCINTYEQVTANTDKKDVATKQETYNALVRKRTEVQTQTWETSAAYAETIKEINAIKATEPKPVVDATVEESRQKKKELTAKRDELIKRLSSRDTNKRIEDEKVKLDKRSRELAQIVADCNEVIRQIKEYKKAKISIVESKVNSYFSLIRWKFYEQNITNDDEKEICTAIDRNGVDYNNTNDGTVINMGIDIINGISKAKDIYVPLFVDRKESVENALPSVQQVIYLQCKYGEPFKMENV